MKKRRKYTKILTMVVFEQQKYRSLFFFFLNFSVVSQFSLKEYEVL